MSHSWIICTQFFCLPYLYFGLSLVYKSVFFSVFVITVTSHRIFSLINPSPMT